MKLDYHVSAASFSETFYGLKRVSKGGKLSTREERLSLFMLVVFPHVRNKLLKLSEKYRLDHADGIVPEKVRRGRNELLKRITLSFNI